MMRTTIRYVTRTLAALGTFGCGASQALAQVVKKGASAPPADSGTSLGEYVLALCAVGIVLFVVCAPSHKAT